MQASTPLQPLAVAIARWSEALSHLHLTLADDAPAELALLTSLENGVMDARGPLEETGTLRLQWPHGLPEIHRLMDLAALQYGETFTLERAHELLSLAQRSPRWRTWVQAARGGLAAVECSALTAREALRTAWASTLPKQIAFVPQGS